MKMKNKLFAVAFGIMLIALSPVLAFADITSKPAPLSITSGLIVEEEKQDATFEESRMVYGEALPFGDISVLVCRRDAEGNLLEDYTENFEVSSLGMFNVSLPLKLGTNYIAFQVSSESYNDATYNFEIKRMPQKVKDELKAMVALPGAVRATK